MGNGEGQIRQGRKSGEACGEPGSSGHRRARVDLHQRLPRDLPDLRVAETSSQSSH